MKRISRKSLFLIFGFVVLRIVADISYFYYVVPQYYYYDFADRRSTEGFIVSWVLTVIFAFLTVKLIERERMLFSDIVVYSLALISIVPYLTLIYAGMLSNKYILMNGFYWLLILMLQIYSGNQEVQPLTLKLSSTKIEGAVVGFIGCFFALVVLYISFYYTDFRINFNLNLVYEIRNVADTYNIPVLIDYLFSWSKIVNIALFAYLLSKKRYIYAAMVFLIQVVSFGIDGTKAPFFMLIIVAGVVLLYRKSQYVKYKKMILWGLVAVFVLGLLEIMFTDSSFIYGVVIRRLMFVPAYLGYCYVDFFSTHVPDYFRGSILRRVGFTSPYGGQLGNMIGANYIYHDETISCNNGLIANAVTNMGDMGILLMPIVLVLILRLVDKVTYGLDQKIYIPIAIYFAIILMNGFLSTALLTHGLIPVCILMLLWRSMKRPSQSGSLSLKSRIKFD